MLSARQLRCLLHGHERTYQTALLLHDRPQITEYIVQLMYSALDISDLGFTFGDQRLLELELLR